MNVQLIQSAIKLCESDDFESSQHALRDSFPSDYISMTCDPAVRAVKILTEAS